MKYAICNSEGVLNEVNHSETGWGEGRNVNMIVLYKTCSVTKIKVM